MRVFEDRDPEKQDDGDKLVFALAGLARVATEHLKSGLNPVRGWTDDYPDRLLEEIDFWRAKIAALRTDLETPHDQ